MDEQKKKKRFRLFNLEKEGKGISKTAPDSEPGLKRFFISYKDNIGKMLFLNIIMVLGNFPLFFLIATLSGVTKRPMILPLSDLFENLFSLFSVRGGHTVFEMAAYGMEGMQADALARTPWTYVFYGLSALFLVTFGLVNVGTAYVLRNIAKGDPIFLWSDFWYAVRRNWKQALPFGAIDALICALLGYNLYILMTNSTFLTSVMFWSNVVIGLAYFFMRYYIYVQMVTFKLSVFKIIKNSARFVLIGLKRNVVAALGIFLLLFIEVLLFFGTGGFLIPVAVALPLLLLFSTFAYMKVYASYFKIKEIMIDPYYAEHPEELPKNDFDPDEVIMHDDVTERERLEEIKRKNGMR